MQQAAEKCVMPQLELKSLPTFLAIKCCQQAKIQRVINLMKLIKKADAYVPVIKLF